MIGIDIQKNVPGIKISCYLFSEENNNVNANRRIDEGVHIPISMAVNILIMPWFHKICSSHYKFKLDSQNSQDFTNFTLKNKAPQSGKVP